MPRLDNGINFYTLTKSLSTGALNHLIEVATKESMLRAQKRTFPSFENKQLPVLKFNHHTVIKIKEIEWKIVSYDISFNAQLLKTEVVYNAYIPDYTINVEFYKWEELVKKNTPIKILLKELNSENRLEIELHSRSKIFWFHKLLENARVEPFERKFSFDTNPTIRHMSIPISNTLE